MKRLIIALAAALSLASWATEAGAVDQIARGLAASANRVTPTGATTSSTIKDLFARSLTVKDFGAKGDGSLYNTCTMSSGGNTISCTSGSFSTTQVGKKIAINGAGAAGGLLTATISSVAGGVATINTTATTALTGQYWQGAFVGTDDTTSFQNALAALTTGQCLRVSAGMYYISGTLSMNGFQSKCIAGDGYNLQSTDFSTPQLMYVGSTGSLLTLQSNAISDAVYRLGLSYFSADYAGNLIVIGNSGAPSSSITFEDFSAGGISQVMKGSTSASGSTYGPAASLFQLLGTYHLTLNRFKVHRAKVAIQGPTDNYTNANGVEIRDGYFEGGFQTQPIQATGNGWAAWHLIFEPYDNGYSASKTCGGIAAATTTSATVIDGFSIGGGTTFEDAANGSGTCIDLAKNGSSQTIFGVSITGTDFGFGGTGVKVGPGSGYLISGNLFRDFATGLDITTGSVTGSFFCGNSYQVVTTVASKSTLSSGSCVDDKDINNNPIFHFTGDFESSGPFHDFSGQSQLSSCANQRWGQFVLQKPALGATQDYWSGFSDAWNVCLSAHSSSTSTNRYGWGQVAFTNYALPTSNTTGVTPLYLTGQTASIATTNLRFAAATLESGLYRIDYYIAVTTGGAGATVQATFGWQDAGAARTATSASVDASTTNYTQGSLVVSTDGVHDLTYAVALAGGTATYNVRLSVTRMQ